MVHVDKIGSVDQLTGFNAGDVELSVFAEEHLYTAVVSDSLDQLGIRHQAMREYLRPLFPACKFAGWARTIACSDVYHISDHPYDLEIEAMDSILPGEVVVSLPSNRCGMLPGES